MKIFKSKKIFTFSVLLIFITGLSQNIDVYYKLEMRPNKNDKSYIENDLFVLQIRNNNSIFYSTTYQNLMANQSAAKEKNVDTNKISSNYIITKEDGVIYHNLFIESDLIKYEELEFPKWEIGNKYKYIDSLKCQEAKANYRGRKYIAWFTNEIPISEGPYKMKNLPGLILDLQTVDNDYHFILDGIQNSDTEINFAEGILISNRGKYLSQIKIFAENPSYKWQQEDLQNSFNYKTYVNGKEVKNNEKYKLLNQFVWNFMKTHNNPLEKDEIWIR